MLRISTLDLFVRVKTRRALVLGSTALVGGCLLLAEAPVAQAACEIDGVAVAPGGDVEPDSGQEVVCLGEGLTDPVVAQDGSSDVTVTIGDGATATELDTADEGAIVIRDDSTVTVNANATVSTSGDYAHAVRANGDANTVTISGGTVSTSGYRAHAVYADGDANTVTISGGTVSTSGYRAHVVYADGDANTVTISGGTVSTSGVYAHVVYADGDANTVTISGGTVSTSGVYADAVYAVGDDNRVTISGGTVSTSGEDAHAVYAVGDDNRVTISGGTVSTSGDYAYAVRADGNANTVTISGGTVSTSGVYAHVVYADGDANTVTISGGTVSTSGEDAHAVYAVGDDNRVTISGGTVSTSGEGADAVRADGDANTVTISGGTVSTSGEGADAVYADGDANTVTISGGTVSTSGDYADAVYAVGDANTVTISGGTVSTSGNYADAVNAVGDDNRVTISGGTVSTSGEDAHAVYAYGDASTVTISGGTVSATGGGASAVRMAVDDGETGQLTLGTGATVIGGLEVVRQGAGLGTVDLTLNGDGEGVFDDTIDGFATIAKTEEGTWILNGDIVNSGPIDIQAGTLALNGTTGSAVTVQSAATLAGTGSVGDITFEDGSTFEVSPDTAAGGERLQSDNDIDIGNDVRVAVAFDSFDDLRLGETVTIIEAANTLNGDFAGVANDFAFIDASLASVGTTATLQLDRNNVAFADVAETPNQAGAAAAADSLGAGAAVFDALVVQDEAGARTAFDQLSGEVHASMLSGLVQDSGALRGIVNTRLRAGQVGTPAQAAQSASLAAAAAASPAGASGLEAWVQAYGSFGRLEGDGNAAELTRTSGGVVLGLEAEVAYDLRAGVFLGYGQGRVEADDRASEAQTDSYTVGAYGSRRFGALRTQVGASFTWHQIDSEREVAFGGLDDDVSADYDARTYQVFAEVGYTFETPMVDLEPFAGFAGIYQETDGFTEEGGASALDVEDGDQRLGVSTLGLRATRDFTMSGGNRLSLDGALAWRHSFGDLAPESTARFAEGSEAFTVAGTPIDEDTLLVETGVSYDLSADMTLSLGYRGEFGQNAQDNAVNAKFALRF